MFTFVCMNVMQRITCLILLLFSTTSIGQIGNNVPLDQVRKLNSISFGFENYAPNNPINGGNYIYIGYAKKFNDNISAFVKLSTDLVPLSFEDFFAEGGFKFYRKMGRSNHPNLGLSYLYDLGQNSETKNDGVVKLRIALMSGVDKKKNRFSFDVLPISINYSLNNEKLSMGYEFFAINFKF